MPIKALIRVARAHRLKFQPGKFEFRAVFVTGVRCVGMATRRAELLQSAGPGDESRVHPDVTRRNRSRFPTALDATRKGGAVEWHVKCVFESSYRALGDVLKSGAPVQVAAVEQIVSLRRFETASFLSLVFSRNRLMTVVFFTEEAPNPALFTFKMFETILECRRIDGTPSENSLTLNFPRLSRLSRQKSATRTRAERFANWGRLTRSISGTGCGEEASLLGPVLVKRWPKTDWTRDSQVGTTWKPPTPRESPHQDAFAPAHRVITHALQH